MTSVGRPDQNKRMGFGLIFFAGGEAPQQGDKYRLVIESAKLADRQGFSSIWIPERHFTKDGCLFPNPAVLQAALARETKQIRLGAGSVVLPLHDPLRVVEEWAMVDNLSGGRVSLSFASGWHPNDFVFFPDRYPHRHEQLYRDIRRVQKLWRGEPITLTGGDGNQVEVRTYPTPIQRDLPIWITSAGNVNTFIKAGEIGANLLTHMFNHSIEELADKIRCYRESLTEHGFDAQAAQVSLMLHTFIGEDPDLVREQVRGTFCEYLKSASYLLNAIAHSRGKKIDLAKLSESDKDDYLQFVFERLLSENRVLFGTPEECLAFVRQLGAIGVNEIACQLDFGVDIDTVLESLPHLNRLKELCNSKAFIEGAADSTEAYGGHLSADLVSLASTDFSFHASVDQIGNRNLLEEIRGRCQEEIAVADFYRELNSRGINLGPSFQGIEGLWRHEGEALGLVRMPKSLKGEVDRYEIHPALLDACCQVLVVAALNGASLLHETDILYVPVDLREVRVHSRPHERVWSYAVLRSNGSESVDSFEGDVRLLDEEGRLIAEVTGMRLQRTKPAIQGKEREVLDGLLYVMNWEPKAGVEVQQSGKAANQQETWLVFADSHGTGEAFARLLEARGEACIRIEAAESYERVGEKRFRMNPARLEDMREILEILFNSEERICSGVVHFWSLNSLPPEKTTSESLQRAQELGCLSVLHLVQCLGRVESQEPTRLWLVTQGAQSVPSAPAPVALAQALLWGLGRTLAQEHPNLWGGLIDLDPHVVASESVTSLEKEIRDSCGEDQIAFRAQQRYVARFVRARQSIDQCAPLRLRHDCNYLITGGLGGLGLLVARWMVERGARYIVIMSRTQLPPRSAWGLIEKTDDLAGPIQAIRDLERLGANVHLVSVDVADEQQMSACFETFKAEGRPPIRGVVHAAATVKGNILLKLDSDSLDSVLRPKVLGGWLLHRLLEGAPLDFFIMFSAIPSLLGWLGRGAANYAAANAFLDALAHYRHDQQQTGLSINWGPWRQAGLVDRSGAAEERLALQGIGSVSPTQGLAVLERLIPQVIPQIAVVNFNWPQFFKASRTASDSLLLSHLVQESIEPSGLARSRNIELQVRHDLLSAEPALRQKLLENYALEKVSQILGVPVSKLDPQASLLNFGLDSIMAIELKNSIDADLGVRVPIATFLQGHSIAHLTAQVLDQLTEAVPSELSSTEVVDETSSVGAETLSSERNDISPTEAAKLLAIIDQISDEEVHSTLSSLMAEKDDESL